MLLSQRERSHEPPEHRNARPAMVVEPRPEVEVGPPQAPPAAEPLAVEVPIPIPSIQGTAPDRGSLPGRWGLSQAPVTIVVFDDFQCPYCARLDGTLRALHERYPTQVEVYQRDYPLEFHQQARGAHIAARCAGQQGAFWAMHDLLFANQHSLDAEGLRRWANALDLDMAAYDVCLDSPSVAWEVEADVAAAQALGVLGTPTCYINGQRLDGAQPQAVFESAIDAALASRGVR
jgi:protein-disulfide isomerase